MSDPPPCAISSARTRRPTGASGGPTTRSARLNYLGPSRCCAACGTIQHGQGLHAAAADRRPEGRPGLARAHAGRAHQDPRRVHLGRRRRARVPRRPALRRRQDQRLPAGLHAVRRPGPRLVRRQALERLRRPHHDRRPGQGQRRADRRSGASSGAASCSTWPASAARTPSTRARRSPTRTSMAVRRRPRASRSSKRDILIIRTGLPAKFLRAQREEFYEGFNEPGLAYSPELVQWFQRHGDPQPRHRHHRQRGHHRPEQRASRCRCTTR